MKTEQKQIVKKLTLDAKINKWKYYIFGFLFLLVCMNGCNSCQHKTKLASHMQTCEILIDSLKTQVKDQKDSIIMLNKDLSSLKSENSLIKQQVSDLRNDKKSLNEINRTNARTINNIVKNNEQ